jgi:REP element-mobilizing transposase RayT
VREALRGCARRADVRIHDFANVGSHLHLLVRIRRRQALQAFLRSFAGIVARKVTGAKRGRPLHDGPFWSALACRRVGPRLLGRVPLHFSQSHRSNGRSQHPSCT